MDRLLGAWRWLCGRDEFSGGWSRLIHFEADGYRFRSWKLGRLNVVWAVRIDEVGR